MNEEDFVEQIVKPLVQNSAFEVTSEILQSPIDGTYPEKIECAILWYQSLKKDEQQKVLYIVKEAIQDTVFRFLVCIDGVNHIDDNGGKLSIYYRSNENPVDTYIGDDYLHDIYRSDCFEWLAE